MLGHQPSRLAASVQAVVVVFVWATSWILVKRQLHDIPALSFAGLRYGLAFVCLLALLVGRPVLRSRRRCRAAGCCCLWPGRWCTSDRSRSPPARSGRSLSSLWGVVAFAAATMLGRSVNRDDGLPALTVTVVSMGIGSGVLLAVAVVHDGVPRLTLSSWLVVVWLAVINTAAAFTVWNHTMRRLSAMESSLINNTMLVHVAVLAWIFLGERPSTRGMLGLVLVAGGVVLVQLRRIGNHQTSPQAHH